MTGKIRSIWVAAVLLGALSATQLAIGAGPQLAYNPKTYDFGDTVQGTNLTTEFVIWNSGCGVCTLNYVLNETCPWVMVAPAQGSATREQDRIRVTVDTMGLSPGYHTCAISISSNGGSGTFTLKVHMANVSLITIENTSITAEEIGSVSINLSSPTNLTLVHLSLVYDATIVTLLNVSPGDSGGLLTLINTSSPGVAQIQWSYPLSGGYTGDFVLCHLVFYAHNVPGNCSSLALENVSLVGPEGEQLLFTVKNGMILVPRDHVEYLDIPAEDAINLLDGHPDVILIDVRTLTEYNEGYIEKAILIPLSSLEDHLSELDTNMSIIVYSKIGGDSITASNILVDHGFLHVYNLVGGITEWIAAGLPIVIPNKSPYASYTYSPENPRILHPISFNSSASYDPDGSLLEYVWDFGDGNGSTQPNPIHTYTQRGAYNVTLTVKDAQGAATVINSTLSVSLCALISITPQYQDIHAGGTGQFTVTIDPYEPIGGIQCDLLFDPSLLMVQSVSLGDTWTGYETYFTPGQIDNINGTVTGIVFVIMSLGDGISQQCNFLNIVVQGHQKNGTSPLEVSEVNIGAPTGIPLLVQLENGSISLYSTSLWDINMDRKVDILDLISMTHHWHETGTPGWISADINKDGTINVLDAILVGQHLTP